MLDHLRAAQVTRRGLFLALALLVLVSDITGLRGAAAQTGDAARMAALQSKIIQIEEELRRLTGRVEQLEYEKREMSDRMDRLVADLDNRLRGLDGTSTTSGSVSVPDAARVEPSVERLPEVSSVDARAPAGPVVTRGGGVAQPIPSAAGAADAGNAASGDNGVVLGTIPRDALLNLPKPSQEQMAAAANLPPDVLSGGEQERFQRASALLRAGSIDAAGTAFRRFVEDFPDSAETPVAAYWVGETYLARGDYAEAAATFARNVRTYPVGSRKAPDNLLKLGVALNALGDSQKACASFDELERRYDDLSVPLRQVLAKERASAGCG
ncbi:MAG: tol-pal system protein YbgF [Geminicoccaceae bacterium]